MSKDMKCFKNVEIDENCGGNCVNYIIPTYLLCSLSNQSTIKRTTKISSTSTHKISSTKISTKSSIATSYLTSTNDKCGAMDGKCPSGECCSKYGFCGRSDQHCSKDQGCQSEFGPCSNSTSNLKVSCVYISK